MGTSLFTRIRALCLSVQVLNGWHLFARISCQKKRTFSKKTKSQKNISRLSRKSESLLVSCSGIFRGNNCVYHDGCFSQHQILVLGPARFNLLNSNIISLHLYSVREAKCARPTLFCIEDFVRTSLCKWLEDADSLFASVQCCFPAVASKKCSSINNLTGRLHHQNKTFDTYSTKNILFIGPE